jgi:hypothetical protein
LVGRFIDIFVVSVKPSSIYKKITISKLFNFFQKGSSIVGISSSLNLLISLYTVKILEVLYRYFLRKFRFIILLFFFF